MKSKSLSESNLPAWLREIAEREDNSFFVKSVKWFFLKIPKKIFCQIYVNFFGENNKLWFEPNFPTGFFVSSFSQISDSVGFSAFPKFLQKQKSRMRISKKFLILFSLLRTSKKPEKPDELSARASRSVLESHVQMIGAAEQRRAQLVAHRSGKTLLNSPREMRNFHYCKISSHLHLLIFPSFCPGFFFIQNLKKIIIW